jgi:hypothetical protein
VKIACYKGTSFQSKAIRFLTRSEYSHAAFLFDEQTEDAVHELLRTYPARVNGIQHIYRGAVVEAWSPTVRSTFSLSREHTPGTQVDIFDFCAPFTRELWPLRIDQEKDLVMALAAEIGTPYDWKDVFRFVTRRPGDLDRRWFCSELVFAKCLAINRPLFERTKAWEVPPGWLPRSPYLKWTKTVITK